METHSRRQVSFSGAACSSDGHEDEIEIVEPTIVENFTIGARVWIHACHRRLGVNGLSGKVGATHTSGHVDIDLDEGGRMVFAPHNLEIASNVPPLPFASAMSIRAVSAWFRQHGTVQDDTDRFCQRVWSFLRDPNRIRLALLQELDNPCCDQMDHTVILATISEHNGRYVYKHTFDVCEDYYCVDLFRAFLRGPGCTSSRFADDDEVPMTLQDVSADDDTLVWKIRDGRASPGFCENPAKWFRRTNDCTCVVPAFVGRQSYSVSRLNRQGDLVEERFLREEKGWQSVASLAKGWMACIVLNDGSCDICDINTGKELGGLRFPVARKYDMLANDDFLLVVHGMQAELVRVACQRNSVPFATITRLSPAKLCRPLHAMAMNNVMFAVIADFRQMPGWSFAGKADGFVEYTISDEEFEALPLHKPALLLLHAITALGLSERCIAALCPHRRQKFRDVALTEDKIVTIEISFDGEWDVVVRSCSAPYASPLLVIPGNITIGTPMLFCRLASWSQLGVQRDRYESLAFTRRHKVLCQIAPTFAQDDASSSDNEDDSHVVRTFQFGNNVWEVAQEWPQSISADEASARERAEWEARVTQNCEEWPHRATIHEAVAQDHVQWEAGMSEPGFSSVEAPKVDGDFAHIIILTFSRCPQRFHEVLDSGCALETIRDALKMFGHSWRLRDGAKMFVYPDMFDEVVRALQQQQHVLGPHHVIVDQAFQPLVLDAVMGLPRRQRVDLREAEPLALVSSDGEMVTVTKTFLDVRRPLRSPQSVIQSEPDQQQSLNPRRFA